MKLTAALVLFSCLAVPVVAQTPFVGGVYQFNCATPTQPCLTVQRTAPNGGNPWQVYNAIGVMTVMQAATMQQEWALTSIVDNRSFLSGGVAVYGQGNAYSNGQVWGGVMEVIQKPGATASLVGLEVNIGTVTPDNGWRYGVHSVSHSREGAQGSGGTAAFMADGGTSSWTSALMLRGNIGAAVDIPSAPTILDRSSLGSYVGGLRVRIDGVCCYLIPIYGAVR